MKNILITLILFIVSDFAFSQSMIVHRTDGSATEIPLSVIDSITFTNLGTVADIDGNIYPIIKICNQYWIGENLKTTRYKNGANIDYPGSIKANWANNTNGAYAQYNNDSVMKNAYGVLYNWYAVSNVNGLCPDGWHVASNDDWLQLTTCVGGSATGGVKLKSCRQVNSPQGGACNTSEHPRFDSYNSFNGTDNFNFSGYPGGTRQVAGTYTDVGKYGSWWSSTESASSTAKYFSLGFDTGSIGSNNSGTKHTGMSVRCIKD